MKRVVISILGSTLDSGKSETRWGRWRPTIALCKHPSLPVDRLELLHDTVFDPLAKRVREDIKLVAPATEVVQRTLNLKDPWDFQEVYSALYDFAQSYAFDTEAEEYLVNITTGTHVAQICWFLLTEARYLPGRLLQLSPPKFREAGGDVVGGYSIVDLDLSRYDGIASRFRKEAEEATTFLKAGIVTRNPAFNRMIDDIERVAIRSKAPFLLTGPTGAGKSQLARRIYELKKARRQISGPFVEVNCATLRGDQAMSALFGHTKGAFTGAQGGRAGLLKSADGGVLFMDEIGELGADEQAMILRAIEDKRFLPVGADKDAHSDFQLIAGTNRDLTFDVRQGKFREDLLARLNLWTFELPSLRERREDIDGNIDFELAKISQQQGEAISFNKEARSLYLNFALSDAALWSANFRDLSSSITRLAILAPNGRINEATVRDEIARLTRLWRGADENVAASDPLDGLLSAAALEDIDRFDRVQLAEVVRVCQTSASLSEAGRVLFAASRRKRASANDADRLRKYLARFGLDWHQIRSAA